MDDEIKEVVGREMVRFGVCLFACVGTSDKKKTAVPINGAPPDSYISFTMTKLTATVLATLVATSAAFAPQQQCASSTSALAAKGYEEVGGVAFDPLSLAKLGTGESFDTFPNMFPNEQFLKEAEIKHGRQAMLAWTGVWATHQVSRKR